jgi:SAM-dependent methyltransferase
MDTVAYEQFERLEGRHWWLRGRRAVFFGVLDHLLDRDRPLRSLDVGCGFGFMVEDLSRYGPAAGLDFFADAVQACRRRGVERVLVSSASTLPAADGTHDLVTFFDCIEHLDDDRAALREAHRILRPGGRVVVTVPAYQFLYANNDRVARHRRRYTVGQVRARLEATGFEVDKATYVNTYLFPLILPAVLALKLKERLRPRAEDPTTNLTHPVPGPLNELLFRIFASERLALRWVSFPFGHSIFVLARRKPGGPVCTAGRKLPRP